MCAVVGVVVVGSWGSQAPAQGQNLKESLEGTGIKVKVRRRSPQNDDDEEGGWEG